MPDEARTGTMGGAVKESSGDSRKASEIIVTNKAFQMAQAWVKSMTGGADSDTEENDESTTAAAFSEPRPARLGLGAKYVPHSLAAASMSPAEKKLRAKISAARHDPTGDHDHPASAFRKETTSDPESEEDNGTEGKDSKTSAFGRKQRNTSANLLMPTSKARKRKRLGK